MRDILEMDFSKEGDRSCPNLYSYLEDIAYLKALRLQPQGKALIAKGDLISEGCLCKFVHLHLTKATSPFEV
jgi:hypothetical protein